MTALDYTSFSLTVKISWALPRCSRSLAYFWIFQVLFLQPLIFFYSDPFIIFNSKNATSSEAWKIDAEHCLAQKHCEFSCSFNYKYTLKIELNYQIISYILNMEFLFPTHRLFQIKINGSSKNKRNNHLQLENQHLVFWFFAIKISKLLSNYIIISILKLTDLNPYDIWLLAFEWKLNHALLIKIKLENKV